MIRRPSSPFTGILLGAACGLFFLSLSFPAFAQAQQWDKACAVDGSLYGIFCSLSNEFRFIPKALSVFSYFLGTMLCLFGLYGFKAHGDDPGQNPLRSAVMKLVVGAILISLPLGIRMMSMTLTGSGTEQNQTQRIDRPCSARGSSVDGSRAVSGC